MCVHQRTLVLAYVTISDKIIAIFAKIKIALYVLLKFEIDCSFRYSVIMCELLKSRKYGLNVACGISVYYEYVN